LPLREVRRENLAATDQDLPEEACSSQRPLYAEGMKTCVSIRACIAIASAAVGLRAQTPELSLPRPGAVVISEVVGSVKAGVGDERREVKADDRVRVGSTVTTGRRSIATVTLSNGAILNLGSDCELEIEEFGQAPFSTSAKVAEMKEEPSVSRTRLRLVRGDVTVQVKPLNVSRGSSFMLTMLAGTVRLAQGEFRAIVQMSDLGLGVCTLELRRGAAEFELPGSAFTAVPLGRKLAFAVEVDSATGAVKVGEMPKETAQTKK
jgi:hypothetical protein